MRIHPLLRFVVLVCPFLIESGHQLGSDRILGVQHFRQAHTAMMARNFAFHDASILRPTIDGVSYGKDLYLNEFPLYPFLVGMLWRAGGGEHLPSARLLALAFGLACLWYYDRLLRGRGIPAGTAALALLLLGATPVVAYFFGRIQRQSLFSLALLAGLHHTLRALDGRGRRDAVAGGVGLAVALLLNPFSVYAFLPLGWYAIRRGVGRAARSLARVAVAAAMPAILWYGYAVVASRGLETEGMLAIGRRHRDLLDLARYRFWGAWEHWENVYDTLVHYVVPSPLALGLCVYGLWRVHHDPRWRLFVVWLGAAVGYLLIDFHPIGVQVHEYYYLNIAPLTALFVAAAVVDLGRRARRMVVAGHRCEREGIVLTLRPPGPAGLLLLVLVVGGPLVFLMRGATLTRALHKDWHRYYHELGVELSEIVDPGSRLTIVAESPCPLLSWVLGAPEASRVLHRLERYAPDQLHRRLEAGDFDYLAVVFDTADFPLDDVLARIEEDGHLERVRRGPHFSLFVRRPGGGGQRSGTPPGFTRTGGS